MPFGFKFRNKIMKAPLLIDIQRALLILLYSLCFVFSVLTGVNLYSFGFKLNKMFSEAENNREISQLDIALSEVDILLKNGFRYVNDVLSMKPFDLAKELSISPQEAASILNDIQKQMNSDLLLTSLGSNGSVISAVDLCKQSNQSRPIITFCKSLDRLLGGGVQVGQITEFCGVPGIGKTQLAIQLALDVQIPEIFTGAGGESIYIDTEGSFIVERVAEMAQGLSDHLHKIANRVVKNASRKNDGINYKEIANELTVDKLLSNIHVCRAHNQTEQMAAINNLPNFLKTHPKVKVIIIDSMAFHFRQDLQEISSRSRILSQIAQTLNRLAYDHKLAVVTINHITSRISVGQGGKGNTTRIIPALGEQWSHCIANRVMMFW